MKLAILGTRGIPANYGGFETFAEELSVRLVRRGHNVTVYCRQHHTPKDLTEFRGVRLVVLPTIRHKYFDTVAHTFVSALHSLREDYDVALVCNAANSIFIPIIRLSGTRVAINVDGLEWKRQKWGRLGKWFYKLSERVACGVADAVVTDAKVIERYYLDHYRAASKYIPYGALMHRATTDENLKRFGLEKGKYFLYVSRFEPENNAHAVLEAYRHLETELRLVMVGDAPYASDYISKLKNMADSRVLFTGYVFGKGYRELMSHAYCYIHATEVGGTHPALVEAMGIGNGIIAADVPENREVAGDGALYFSLSQPEELKQNMALVLEEPGRLVSFAANASERASLKYNWTKVTEDYEVLLRALVR